MNSDAKMFAPAQIVEMLIRAEGIHTGIWGLAIKFGFGASNVSSSDNPDHYLPAAIVPIHEIGIQEFDKPSNLTVDAAKVNPRPKKRVQGKKKTT